MAGVADFVKGKIVGYDERTNEVTIVATYTDLGAMLRREYKEVEIRMVDSRPLSERQRRCCFAMIREIAKWCGDLPSEVKEYLKLDFISSELCGMMESFSLSNAPMSVIAEFQRWLARFIVRNDVPTKYPVSEYIDDIGDYVYACLMSKKCCVCGRKADLHHVDRLGMGADRTDVVHEGMEALPLCRTHHMENHSMPDSEFFEKYHLEGGVVLDKALCKVYGLKRKKG